MARHEEDREDLFAELKSFSPRWELRLDHEPEPVVVGQRQDGRLAIYFAQDPCFHFDGASRLLRAFVQGSLYRTQGTSLARLQRRRTPGQTQLVRSDLQGPQLEEFLQQAGNRIQRLGETLHSCERSRLSDESRDLGDVNGSGSGEGQPVLPAPSVRVVRAVKGPVPMLFEVADRILTQVLPLRLAPAYPTRRR